MSATSVPPDWQMLEKNPNSSEVLDMIEQRFPTSIIDFLLELGFERAEVFTIVIPARTLQHRRSRKEPLTIEESDRVVRLLRVLKATEDLYESRERALGFLRRPNPRLDPALRNVPFARGGRLRVPLRPPPEILTCLPIWFAFSAENLGMNSVFSLFFSGIAVWDPLSTRTAIPAVDPAPPPP